MPKEHKPKISVIIVTSNNRTHIGECFDSVLCQPFSDIEVIAVDVLSTDGTKELISETAEEDRRVIFLADSMGSIGRAKNKAIDYARAPYIVMVEPEDYIDGKMLGHLYHSMEEDPEADMMNCEVDSFGDEAFGKSNRDIKRQYRDANKMDDRVRQRESRLFRWGLFENMSIYRASFLREQNIRHYDAPGYGRQNVAFRFLAMEKGRCNLSAIIHYYRRMDAPKPLITDKKAVQDVAGEYRYLMERLKEDRGEAWQKYRNTFWQAYFESSMMLYEKLSGDLKPLLSRRMQEDLRNAIRRKECSEKNFDVRYKEQMGLLLKSVTEFDESIQDVLSEQQKRRTEYLAKQDGMGSRIAVKDDGSKFRVRNKAGIRIEKEMFSAETRKAADTTQSSRINRHWLLNEMSRDLAALRMLIGFSADEMGDMLGMSKSMYKSIESGKREISWDQFMALLFIFRYNERTSAVVDTLGLYPEPLKLRLQKGIISG